MATAMFFSTPLGKNLTCDQMKKLTVTIVCFSLYSFLVLGTSYHKMYTDAATEKKNKKKIY